MIPDEISLFRLFFVVFCSSYSSCRTGSNLVPSHHPCKVYPQHGSKEQMKAENGSTRTIQQNKRTFLDNVYSVQMTKHQTIRSKLSIYTDAGMVGEEKEEVQPYRCKTT